MSETITEPEADELAPVLLPATELDDLFADEPEIDLTPTVITDDLDEDELRARLAKAEKAVVFERDLRVKTAAKTWASEATEHFPYSQPDKIQAESRRDFLRQAKEQDQAFRTQAAPLLARLDEREAELRATVQAEEEAKAREAWGAPSVGVPAGPVDEGQFEQRLAEARQSRSLVKATKAFMDARRI